MMEEINKKAFSQVVEVLKNTERDIVEKIPQEFMNFLYENCDGQYKPEINFEDENWEKLLDEDALELIAVIFRDYIATEEEKAFLLEEERKAKMEKYNPDNIFKNKQKQPIVECTELVEIKQASWFEKLIKKILSLFGKK